MSNHRKRANLASCTPNMLEALGRLRVASEQGHPFIYMDESDPRTLRALVARDWVVCSIAPKGIDEPRYRITRRGQKAYEIYSIPPDEYDERRFDGICCRCGERERGAYSTGTLKPYCDECLAEKNTRSHALFGNQKKEGLCPDCGIRDKHVTSTGYVKSYCLPCRRKRSRVYRARSNRRKFERVQAGEVLLCYRCKKHPRYVTGQTVQDYCVDCQRDYWRKRRMIDYVSVPQGE